MRQDTVTGTGRTLMLVLGMAASGGSLAAQGGGDKAPTAQEVQAEVAEAARAVEDYTAEQRDEAVRQVRSALGSVDARIDALTSRLESRGESMSEAARKETREMLRALRARRQKVAEWYGALKHSSANAWQHVRHGFADAYRSMVEALGKAEQEFRGQPAQGDAPS